MITQQDINKIAIPLTIQVERVEAEFHLGCQGGGCEIDSAPFLIEYTPRDIEIEETTLYKLEFDVHWAIIRQIAMYFDGNDAEREIEDEDDVRNDPQLGTIIGNLMVIESAMGGLNESLDNSNGESTLIVARGFSTAAIHIGLAAKTLMLNGGILNDNDQS